MEVLYACTRTYGATARRASSLGTFLADGHGDNYRALQLANGAIYDRGGHQWSFDALYQHRLWSLDCHRFCRADLQYGHGLLRLQPRPASLALLDGADHL